MSPWQKEHCENHLQKYEKYDNSSFLQNLFFFFRMNFNLQNTEPFGLLRQSSIKLR